MNDKKTCFSKSILEPEDFEEPPPLNGMARIMAVNDYPSISHYISEKCQVFRERFFPEASSLEWNDWKWQIRNSITSFEVLSKILHLSNDEIGFTQQSLNLPVRITPYYASLLSASDASHPLRRTMVPVLDELILSKGEESDPLGEGHDSPVPLIVHRYPDRALFLVTDFCSAYCRYCTRSHMVSKKKHAGSKLLDDAIKYVATHPEIRDVIVSGGDPLTQSDERLEYILSHLRAIPHLEIIRIGTKVPVVLPMRITPKLTRMLKKYHPLFMSLHFTHPDEMTTETKKACTMLADAGIPLGSQTVLLKGVNDEVDIMKKLMHELLMVRVRPYYIYQCDPIPGSLHFRTPVSKGLEIIKGLRGHTSGYAVPHYVIDAPGGGGKIPLLPEYYQEHDGENVVLKNFEGKYFKYYDPVR
ncbi:MAG: KamA family radical SAM protein [Bacteroidales bacterium]|jgi:lysine 2,3-aminomutase|nr:KamA family radical SAM protein [Bacteroidales bacterium]